MSKTAAQNDAPASIESVYIVGAHVSTAALTDGLRALLPVRQRAIVRRRFTMLDTCDGRVSRAGGTLIRWGGEETATIAWQSPTGSNSVSVATAQPLDFVWDLPDGALRDLLSPVVGSRRLLAHVDAETSGDLLEILDRRRKTVARIRVESGQVRPADRDGGWQPLPTTITLSGLRGYETVYTRLKPVVESRPGLEPCPEGPLAMMMERAGAAVLRDLSLPQLSLSPTVPAAVGARQLHLALLNMLTANEAGVRAAIDSECLHDFRVAIRRTRSLLTQLRGVFAPDVIDHFSQEFAWIGRLAGPPRDLDVLLLALRASGSTFPAADLNVVIAALEGMRQADYRELIQALNSERYRDLLTSWDAALRGPVLYESGDEKRLLVNAISERGARLSRRLSSGATGIDQHTAAAELHRLRIIAKKLRYLIDVSPSFYDADDLERVMRPLRRLQRELGEFNDAHVQERRLLQYHRSLAAAGGASGALQMLRRLAVDYRRVGDQQRRRVVKSLRRFRRKKIRQACRRLFSPQGAR